jgi:hypothetical protein
MESCGEVGFGLASSGKARLGRLGKLCRALIG